MTTMDPKTRDLKRACMTRITTTIMLDNKKHE